MSGTSIIANISMSLRNFKLLLDPSKNMAARAWLIAITKTLKIFSESGHVRIKKKKIGRNYH